MSAGAPDPVPVPVPAQVETIVESDSLCALCGYCLHGLTEPRCPECGTGFDPAELARLAALPRVRRPFPRRLLIPIVLLVISMFAPGGRFRGCWTAIQAAILVGTVSLSLRWSEDDCFRRGLFLMFPVCFLAMCDVMANPNIPGQPPGPTAGILRTLMVALAAGSLGLLVNGFRGTSPRLRRSRWVRRLRKILG